MSERASAPMHRPLRGKLLRPKHDSTVTPLTCSFCGKDKSRVEKLIAGPNVFICNECVALCNEIIEEARRGPAHD